MTADGRSEDRPSAAGAGCLRTVAHWDDVALGQEVLLCIRTPGCSYDVSGLYLGLRRTECGEAGVCIAGAAIHGKPMGYSEFVRRAVVRIQIRD